MKDEEAADREVHQIKDGAYFCKCGRPSHTKIGKVILCKRCSEMSIRYSQTTENRQKEK